MPDLVMPKEPAPAIFRLLSSERLFIAILSLALLLPLGLSRLHNVPFIGLPIVTSGDEPHYLLMLNSLLSDHDLDLANNYDAARRGSLDLGRNRAGAPLDHQVAWYAPDGSWHEWGEIFEYRAEPANGPSALATLPQLKPGAPPDFSRQPQFSQHPPGLALLLAPALYPVRGTRWVEHFALVLSALATFATALFLRQLLCTVSPDPGVVNAATLVAVLGTPVWHYGRTLFCEPWLTMCAVGALALATRRNFYFLAGCLIAVGIQLKPPFALLALPLLVDRVLSGDLRRAASFALPIGASVALVLLENQYFFGSPFHSAQPWASGNLLVGIAGLLFSWNHGLLPFAPAVLVAVLGFRSLLRTRRRVALLSLASFAPYFLLMSLWSVWRGGYCYGPRLIVPIVPFLFLGLVEVFQSFRAHSAGFRRFVSATCTLSLLISAAGALVHLAFWEKHPLITPVVLLAQHL